MGYSLLSHCGSLSALRCASISPGLVLESLLEPAAVLRGAEQGPGKGACTAHLDFPIETQFRANAKGFC